MEIKGRDFIQRLKSDDREAYNYLFLKYYMQLFYIALKYLEETEDAKDMVQSTLIKLWESKADLMPDQDIKPYLFTIHKNNCLDRLKNKKNTLHKNTVGDFDIAARDKPQSGTADDNLIAQELEFKIIKAISKLPERCRIIFEYSRFRNYTYPEIALKLNISVKTVETQMSIALDRLRMQLADLLPVLFFIIMLKI